MLLESKTWPLIIDENDWFCRNEIYMIEKNKALQTIQANSEEFYSTLETSLRASLPLLIYNIDFEDYRCNQAIDLIKKSVIYEVITCAII